MRMDTSYGLSSLPASPVRVCVVAVFPSRVHTRIQNRGMAERKAASSENSSGKEKHEALQPCQRKRTTSHYAIRRGRGRWVRICVLPWISWGLQDLSPGMSPIAARHFEHGSEASTLFTCALAYVYARTPSSNQRTTETHCARAGSLARAALSGRSGTNPPPLSPLHTFGALLCSGKRQAPSPSMPRHLQQRHVANAKQGSAGNTHVTVNGRNG